MRKVYVANTDNEAVMLTVNTATDEVAISVAPKRLGSIPTSITMGQAAVLHEALEEMLDDYEVKQQ